MDPSEPLSKRLPFTSLKTRQWLLFWNCSNGEMFFGTAGRFRQSYIFSGFMGIVFCQNSYIDLFKEVWDGALLFWKMADTQESSPRC